MSQCSSLRSFCMVVVVAVGAALPVQADAPLGRYTASMGMVTDKKTGLTWQQTEAPGDYMWLDAKEYCTNLNLNGVGWRLPTVKELMTLADHSKINPSIDTSANGFPGASGEDYWSATPYAGAPSSAWYGDFYNGYASYIGMTFANRVRCVR